MEIKKIVQRAMLVIFANEGNYKSVNENDNGALSIGKVQWHGNRALAILKKIINMDRDGSMDILGHILYDDIVKSVDWSHRILNVVEESKISALIDTHNGHKAQDNQSEADVTAYIANGMKLKITDPSTLVYYADVENQGGAGASRRIGQAAIKITGDPSKVTLDIYHNCALKDSVMSKYSKRRNIVYNKCKTLFPKNPFTTPTSDVEFGDTSSTSVKWVQWELNEAGWNLKNDGDFGSKTDKAVKEYQTKYGLKVDGVVGLKTREHMINN